MPRRERSGKSIFFEAIFVIGSLVVIGHLSANYWEKFFIQTEITQVKTSLNNLKKTIADIGYAYDNLNQEMNGLTAHSVTENDLPSMHTAAVGHKYKSKYTADRRRSNDVKVNSVITGNKFAKSNPIYKDNKTSGTVANVTTNTNTKAAADVSTVVSKANATLGVKSTFISNKRPAAKAKSTITTNAKPAVEVRTVTTHKRPVLDAKSTFTTYTKPVAEVNTVATNQKPVSDAKSTITTNTRGNVCECESTIAINTKQAAKSQSIASTKKKPISDAKSTTTTNTRGHDVYGYESTIKKPVVEVRTATIYRKPVTAAKSTSTTNTRAHVDAKSTITTNTRPDVSTITSKIKTAEDVSTITRHPLKSTAAGLCHQHEDCIHEQHCKHNNFHYYNGNNYHKNAYNTLKY